ncbi:MAG: tRNA (adenosine(37)-N6)-threonylcarbamoyltransferase complex transferase subunit TsaD [Heliobacteriaceae bacterium]|jgi:N6-L-threonylcarbamoyladenine synthase|nr:tRNA (adenosine(37)-N6)-threonylcarbamoyltransferase complex transferase subunit TsaD [Heliobacteriaceae bacterium]
MNILAIETSCDETACAIVKDGREVAANVVASQIKTHERYGGVIPEIAAREHLEAINIVIEEAFRQAKENAGLEPQDIDAFAGTVGPGLVGCLLVGLNAAKTLALVYDKPFIGVNHLNAHICANYIDTGLKPPFIALLVSGGHTQIIDVKSYAEQNIIGETIDDAVGEAYDKVARLMGLPYPGGPVLDELAQQGNPQAFKLPEGKVDGCNFSFSGLKTAVSRLVKSFENQIITPVQIKANTVPEFQKVSELKKWLHENVVSPGNAVVKSNGRNVLFSKTGVERSIKRASNTIRTQAYCALKELMENSVYGGRKNADARHLHRVKGQELYYSSILYDGKLYGIEIKVDIPLDKKNKNYIYSGHKVKIMASVATRVSTNKGSGSYDTNAITCTSITDVMKNFNPQCFKNDLCASFQECVSSTLINKLKSALEKSGYNQVVIAGGVAANSEIRRKISELEGCAVFIPQMKYCTDNAAMVASCAYFNTNTFNDLDVEVFSRVK